MKMTLIIVEFLVLIFLGLRKTVAQDITNIEDVKVLSELPLERLLSIKRGFTVEQLENDGNSTDDEVENREIPHALALQGKVKLKDRGGHGGGHGHSQPTYYYEEYYEKDSKSHKIQSIFQLSITSLAFLAFGGYLLCLLIHAIKGKQNYNANPVMTQALAAYLATKIRQVKNQNKFKKRRKNLKLQRRPNVVQVPRPNRNMNLQKRPNDNYNYYNYDNINTDIVNKNNNTNVQNEYTYKIVRRQPRPKREVIGTAGGYIVYDDMYFALLDLSEAYTKYHTIDYVHYNKTRPF